MQDLLQTLLESNSDSMNEAITAMFNVLFENTLGKPSSQDAIQQLTDTVGENIHKTDDGTKVVGLAANAGLGSEPLPGELDSILNDVNTDIAENMVLPELPTEDDLSNLPTGGGTADNTEYEDDPDFDLTAEEAAEPVLDEPMPDDFSLPMPTEDTGTDSGGEPSDGNEEFSDA